MNKKILVIGASGYVGSRLVPQLIHQGYQVRTASRSIEKLKTRFWANDENVELISADVFDLDSLKKAFEGCTAVYYLVHSMNEESQDFSESDKKAAQNTIDTAHAMGIERLIYLGGLGEKSDDLSKHLRSRMEVSDILHQAPDITTTLRAAMIIGIASASYELLAYLVKRLPVMVTPIWIKTEAQPIFIRNVLGYLIGCLQEPKTKGQGYDIGGPDIVSYRQLFEMYAQQAKLRKRIILPMAALTPHISSYWINLITPVSASLARPLVESLKNRVICHDHRIQRMIPQRLITCRRALRLTLGLDRIKEELFDGEFVGEPLTERINPGDPPWA